MRIISYNLNGIRAAVKKGFFEWLKTDPADIICLQEVKAHIQDIDVKSLEDLGYKTHWFCAQKKGYSGVGILSKIQPDSIYEGCQIEQSDFEGRILKAKFGDITVISAYFPSGTSGDERQAYKCQWLNEFYDYITEFRKTHPKLVICGDYNIAHKEIDIHDPKGNKKSSGFLPEEKAWMDKFMEAGFVDTFRHLNKEPHQYSWWSQRFPSVRLNNKGWRIDYISVTENLKDQIVDVKILPDVKHSDHCPVYLELS